MKMTKEHSATRSSQSPTGLVLEGGGLRAMFTSGVLDVFMQNDIRFDAAVGVSAGVLFGCNYKSNQPGRALRYNIRFRDNPEYMSWKSLFRTGNYVNERFSYHLLPHVYDPMDFDAYRENPMRVQKRLYCMTTVAVLECKRGSIATVRCLFCSVIHCTFLFIVA